MPPAAVRFTGQGLDRAWALVDLQQFRNRLLTVIFPYRGWPAWTRLSCTRLFGRPSPFDTAVDTFIAAVRRQIRLIITEHLMTIALPQGVLLRLGADLRAEFPPSLQHIINADLLAMLAQIDPSPNSTHDTGAVDWADLPERLHFIADLFRCYQEWRDLFDAPFTPEQVVALKAGHLPPGRL